jgi:hypothetical protein
MPNNFRYHKLILSLACTILPFNVQAELSHKQIITNANLTEVANTIQLKSNEKPLPSSKVLTSNSKQSTNFLIKLGCLPTEETKLSNQSSLAEDCPALKPLTIDYPVVPASLTSVLNQLLEDKVFEGYNIKEQEVVTSSESGKNIILYGHSSLPHAKQLITLLKINNIDFTWQLIAKSSAFNIREDWQDTQPEEQVETIRTGKEYDVRFTFADKAEQQRFMPLINQFAKKDSGNETGLIIDAWWQPFYRTFYSQESFVAVKRVSLQVDGFVGSTLVLPSDLNKVLKQINTTLLETNTKVAVSSEDVWVNPAFYRYLNGGYK